ncbi:MAG: energy-coupling factor transporter ATPase [Anaerorhabdus sp.]|uniref:Energy-coupling factor transporter ATP-binding protein EcfA2 n=1 Tax=bioreactor metagenome TaxID=1076179 RepID=A0A645DSY1_9ZZZZ|nr:energy-coupling factor transporter ATPase [Anaerorhabdus sp.]MEA4875281.1 energy-coupling factor transporter ATPase [Anaerorhabdus sp.]
MSIRFEKVSHTYSANTPFAYAALKNIDLDIEEGKMTAIIGATGSGKTTLVQHLNALLLPTSGKITILDRTIEASVQPKKLKSLRKDVGLVFQFPEYQLFEETILKDIIFGPKNFGVSEEEATQKAIEALRVVDLDDSYLSKSPLDLSGGQKRRVAIAGILAMDPKVLVLDEPTAGLDPQGAKQMMELFKRLNKEFNKTVLIVTHDMEHVLNYCDEVVVVKDGEIYCKEDVKTFFTRSNLLTELNILPPAVIQMKNLLSQRGIEIDEDCFSVDELAKAISKKVKNHE